MGLNGTDNVGSGASDEEVAREASTPDEVTSAVWSDGVAHAPADVKNTNTEIANGVDASTLASEAQKDLATHGYRVAYFNGQPRVTKTIVSGGGSVSFVDTGADITPGATTGDSAAVAGTNPLFLDAAENFRIRHHITFRTQPPTTDRIDIGLCEPTNNGEGLYYRTDDETWYSVHSGGSVKDSVSASWPGGRHAVIEVAQGGKVAWEHAGSRTEWDLSYTNWNASHFISAVSNGSGDRIQSLGTTLEWWEVEP